MCYRHGLVRTPNRWHMFRVRFDFSSHAFVVRSVPSRIGRSVYDCVRRSVQRNGLICRGTYKGHVQSDCFSGEAITNRRPLLLRPSTPAVVHPAPGRTSTARQHVPSPQRPRTNDHRPRPTARGRAFRIRRSSRHRSRRPTPCHLCSYANTRARHVPPVP